MKIGFSTNLTWHGAPVADVARTAESIGFESMWMGEHIIIPAEVRNPSLHVVEAIPPEYRNMAEPIVWLTAAAMATERIRLGLNVCLVPQRHPILLAKQLASLDRISRGRLLFGAGAGWIEEEAAVMGYPLRERWARTMEHLRVVRKLWTEPVTAFAGQFVNFPAIYCYPKPVQTPHPPILIGSGGPGLNNIYALRRVAELANGWIPCFLDPARMKAELATLKALCEERGRDFAAMDISVVLPASQLGAGDGFASMGTLAVEPADARDLIGQYREAGVHRIVLGLVDLTEDNYRPVLERAGRAVGLL
jgi:probable F420-dependent oxidoreductase